MKENSLVPANEIWYTTVDGKPIDLSNSSLEEPVSNTYNDGKGVLVFDEPIEYIDQSAFEDCVTLRKIVIPEGVETIYDGAFAGCTGLEEVVVPSSVTKITRHAFVYCCNLKAIYVPEDKVDFHKNYFPLNMRWLIVAEGSELPVKAELVAKDVLFSLRVIALDNETDSNILSAAKKKLEDMWEIEELIHFDTITDSKEPYDKDKDYDEDNDGGYMWEVRDDDDDDEDWEEDEDDVDEDEDWEDDEDDVDEDDCVK